MHKREHNPDELISTGSLPPAEQVQALVAEAHDRFRGINDGAVADYIPALGRTPPERFGVCIVSVSGAVYPAGETDSTFSIQSISKPFVFGLVCQQIGPERARQLLGVDSTGQPFNSVVAIESNPERTGNPMVNAGAIAATSLAPGETAEEKWEFVRQGLSRFAGRSLELDDEVYSSEAASNSRNRGIARLLEGYGRIYSDPLMATDLYTRQCALAVTARDLATMGATLADGGVNPITGDQVLEASICARVLAVMATAGLYEHSGEWLYDIGLPGKSGVSGGIITVSPGKGGLATFAPPLDSAGNSVRGKLATRFLSERLGLNLFASKPDPRR
jgi:glutaminase